MASGRGKYYIIWFSLGKKKEKYEPEPEMGEIPLFF